MGSTDKLIRIIIAAVIGILFWQNIISGALAYSLLTLAVIFVVTSFISFCPLYKIFNLNTCKIK